MHTNALAHYIIWPNERTEKKGRWCWSKFGCPLHYTAYCAGRAHSTFDVRRKRFYFSFWSVHDKYAINGVCTIAHAAHRKEILTNNTKWEMLISLDVGSWIHSIYISDIAVIQRIINLLYNTFCARSACFPPSMDGKLNDSFTKSSVRILLQSLQRATSPHATQSYVSHQHFSNFPITQFPLISKQKEEVLIDGVDDSTGMFQWYNTN